MANLIRYIIQDDPEKKETVNYAQTLAQKNFSSASRSSEDIDRDIRERMYPVIRGHEDFKEFPYKDSKGYITVGFGSNVNKEADFDRVNWVDNQGTRIRPDQAKYYYNYLKNLPGTNYKADYYKNKTPLRISEETARRMYDNHARNDLNDLHTKFADFNKFPPELQNVLFDIKYNTGNVDQEEWPNLHKAIAQRNIKDILNNVHRQDVDIERNNWAEREIRKIKSLDY